MFERRQRRMTELVAELRERTTLIAAGGGEAARERHRSRGKLTARERIDRVLDPGTAFLELNALAAWDLYAGDAPGAGIVTGIGRDRGSTLRRRGQRRDGQGRLLLPAHGEEAPARAGGGASEPTAVPVPRRLGRSVPPAAGGRIPGPGSLRSHLLQPGAHVGARDTPDGDRDGLVHGRGGLRASDERRDGDRARHRHDLHRRPPAREGGDRTGRHGGGAGRGRRAHAPLGCRRPPCVGRRARAGDRRARSSCGSAIRRRARGS